MKGFPFFGDELFYHTVVVIKPVLVFFGLVPKGGFAGIEDIGFEQVPVLFDVIRVFLLKTFPKTGLKPLLGDSVIQTFKVESWPDLLLLYPPLPLEFDG